MTGPNMMLQLRVPHILSENALLHKNTKVIINIYKAQGKIAFAICLLFCSFAGAFGVANGGRLFGNRRRKPTALLV